MKIEQTKMIIYKLNTYELVELLNKKYELNILKIKYIHLGNNKIEFECEVE